MKGNIKEERYYFGDYEIYRKFVSGTLDTERTTVNISDDKEKIATVDTQTVENSSLTINPTEVIRYQYSNHLGSASLELDDLAEIISYEEYHPFGTTSYRSGRTETETSQKRYKYVGKERDEETGLYYYGARYYAAWICRFVCVDPLQFKYPQLSPFQYAGNDPIGDVDIDGLEGTKQEERNTEKTNSNPKFESGNEEFDELANDVIEKFGDTEATIDITIHNVDDKFIGGQITITKDGKTESVKYIEGEGFCNEEGEPIKESIRDGAIIRTGQQLIEIGSDLQKRKVMYADKYKADLEIYDINPTRTNKAQAAVNRQNNLVKTREAISPLGKTLSENKKSTAKSLEITKKIAFEDKRLGRSTNRGVDKFIPARNMFKAAGYVALLTDIYFATNRVMSSGFDAGVIAEEIGGIAGALMGGAMGAKLGLMAAPFLGPFAPLGPLLGGIIGAAIGAFVGSGKIMKGRK
ncbi:MAG: hypothetical protein GQ564_12895 [Bacteroidales bacterium]|nr:hypothetical protein [Bacteroidales bacterium]